MQRKRCERILEIESFHLSFSNTGWLMRVLGPIVVM